MKRIFVDGARVKNNYDLKSDLKPVIVMNEKSDGQLTYLDMIVIKTKQGEIVGRVIYNPDHTSDFGEKVWLELDESMLELELIKNS